MIDFSKIEKSNADLLGNLQQKSKADPWISAAGLQFHMRQIITGISPVQWS